MTTLLHHLCSLAMLTHIVASVHRHEDTSGKLMVCYYTPSSYFPVSQVPYDICTHIIYAFGSITAAGIQPTSPGDLQNYKALVQLKQKNPNLKILISLQKGFSSVVGNSTDVMRSFSRSAVQFLRAYGFDGVDLDWEFPTASQKDSFKKFIEILFNETGEANLLLSAALPNNPTNFKGYDVDCLSRCLDFMTAMTYDFHLYIKNVDVTTGYNSPLFTPEKERGYLSTSGMITHYIESGIPANKLLMGIPLYGRSWTLANAAQHGLNAPAVGTGDPGPYRHVRGVYIYPDVCVALQNGANNVLDDKNGASYLYFNTTWVSYDGTYTLGLKISWMKSQNLAGIGIWAMHLDDSVGICKSGLLPLLTAIRSDLQQSKINL